MRVLLVYPEYPKTYWSFHYALKFISKKAGFPPLGLITIAAMLPDGWDRRLVDMNVARLRDADLLWADYVFISAMTVQKTSAREVIDRCKRLGVRTAAGGPLFACSREDYDDVDVLLLNEGELTLPAFLRDLEEGGPKHLYTSSDWADLAESPVPSWDLVDISKYASLNIQYSRGCPFNCDFCNVTALFGHTPRTKSADQLVSELDAIYARGWRGGVFFVDDNFIGNRKRLKEEILPVLIQWMEEHRAPFSFVTETSINLSDDEELLDLMTRAGFDTVFIGIETVNEDSLLECNKLQNKNRDMIACVRRIQRAGIQVQGGFILGFDNDGPDLFGKMIGFIQESGIVSAMVGLLNAPRGTRLYKRLEGEGRLTEDFSGDNTSMSLNFIPRMDSAELISGYRKVVGTIYSPENYYRRVINFLREFRPVKTGTQRLKPSSILAFVKSNVILGIAGKERLYYWKLLFWSLFTRPRLFPLAITFSIYGFHYRKVYENYLDE